jgi:two-component system response regulator AtoC
MAERRTTVLVVDGAAEVREPLTEALQHDYHVLRAATGEVALQLMEKHHVELILLDIHLAGISGIEVLKIAKENYPYVKVIITSATKELDATIEVMRCGAYHYISKDSDIDGVRTLVAHAGERQDLNRHVMRLRAEVAEQVDREFIVEPSRSTREVVDLVRKVAALPATVLILGESGTGKELLARLIHRESGAEDSPFVAINLAAIPHDLVESTLFVHEKGAFTGTIRQRLGKFELATGGTLFLEEVGDLRYELQAKLLRAIQEGEIERVGSTHTMKTDFRLIAATNSDLNKAVKAGTFLEDLFYRLNVIPIQMPALRDRIEDVLELARFFLRRFNIKFRKDVQGIADEDLPIEFHAAQLSAAEPAVDHLLDRAVSTFERNFIIRALEKEG